MSRDSINDNRFFAPTISSAEDFQPLANAVRRITNNAIQESTVSYRRMCKVGGEGIHKFALETVLLEIKP